ARAAAGSPATAQLIPALRATGRALVDRDLLGARAARAARPLRRAGAPPTRPAPRARTDPPPAPRNTRAREWPSSHGARGTGRAPGAVASSPGGAPPVGPDRGTGTCARRGPAASAT